MAWRGNRPSSFSLQIKADAEKKIKEIGMDLIQGVVMTTPVDTGAARSNWIASKTPIKTYDANASDKSGQGAINRTFVFFAQNIKLGSLIYIQNNLPYIERLENGYSKQAPHGMVSTTMNAIMNKYGG